MDTTPPPAETLSTSISNNSNENIRVVENKDTEMSHFDSSKTWKLYLRCQWYVLSFLWEFMHRSKSWRLFIVGINLETWYLHKCCLSLYTRIRINVVVGNLEMEKQTLLHLKLSLLQVWSAVNIAINIYTRPGICLIKP